MGKTKTGTENDDEPKGTPDNAGLGVSDDLMQAVAGGLGHEWSADAQAKGESKADEDKDDADADADAEGDETDKGDEGAEDADEAGQESDEEADDESDADEDDAEADDDANDEADDEESDQDADNEKAKPKVQQRIDQLTRQKREAEEALEREKTVAAELRAKVTDLEARGAKVQQAPDDVLVATSEDDIDKAEGKLRDTERLLMRHWDGYEAKEGEQSFTAEQVRERYAQVKEQRETLIPRARAVLAQRRQIDAYAAKKYPTLFDAKSEDFTRMQSILRAVPALRAMPSAKLMIGDMLRGAAARAAEETKGKDEKPVKKAPKVPAAPQPSAKAAPVVKKKAPEKDVSAERFVSNGGDRDALVRELAGVL